MDRKKLAIVSRQVSGVTGTTTTVIEHSRRLAALGWEIHVFGESLDARRLREAGALTHLLPRWPWGSVLKRRLFSWLAGRAVGKGRFDVVHGHGDSLAQDVLSLHNCVHAAHEAVHGEPLGEDSGVGRIHREILEGRRFRLLIANSRLMKREVETRFGVPDDSIRVVYPGFDPGRFSPRDRARLRPAARRELRAGPDDVLVGFITSGDFKKRGLGAFIEALAGLAPRTRERVKALVVGKEKEVGAYRQQARRAGVADRISFLPAVLDVERTYHALDAYVHPALYEEFGQSVQEAMACGLPVVTSAMVGASELMHGESRRFLMEKPEPQTIGWKIEALAEDGELRRRLGAEGVEACRRNTWDDNFKATLACYERIIKVK